jgi:hypothetical protein
MYLKKVKLKQFNLKNLYLNMKMEFLSHNKLNLCKNMKQLIVIFGLMMLFVNLLYYLILIKLLYCLLIYLTNFLSQYLLYFELLKEFIFVNYLKYMFLLYRIHQIQRMGLIMT